MPPPKKRVKEEVVENVEELNIFSFSPKGLTAKQCYDQLVQFESIPQFNNAIPDDERLRFLTKAFKSETDVIIKCMDCDKTYGSPTGISVHMKKCSGIQEKSGSMTKILTYADYRDDIAAFRSLDKKSKSKLIRTAMTKNNGSTSCILCGRVFQHQYGLIYHLDRCQLDKADQPWKCYRCGFESNATESELHLRECKEATRAQGEEKVKKLMQGGLYERDDDFVLDDEEKPILNSVFDELRTPRGMTPRVLTNTTNGSIRMKFRKSALERDTTTRANKFDQEKYESKCRETFEQWKERASKIKICHRLENIGKVLNEMGDLNTDDPLNEYFEQGAITVCSSSQSNTDSSSLPNSEIIECFGSGEVVDEEKDRKAVFGYCGAPVNEIKIAPNKLPNGDDIVCVSTFSNRFDLEADSGVIQFWRHRIDSNQSDLKLWFILHLPDKGIVSSIRWLQLPRSEESEAEFIGFLAVATTLGQVLIYRMTSNGGEECESVQLSREEPHLILNQPKIDRKEDENHTIEHDDSYDEDAELLSSGVPPIVRMTWCAENGGKTLAAINAIGALVVWDLDGDLNQPVTFIDTLWQSPPTDLSFVSETLIAVSFKEKYLRVLNLEDWSTFIEDNTLKTTGARVHCDSRIFPHFFTYQAEYLNFPFVCGNNVSYLSVNEESSAIIIVPMANVHQITIWDIALCPGRGILTSCGIDGRLVAGASGKVVPNQTKTSTYYAKNTLFRLHRKQLESKDEKLDNALNEVVDDVKEEIRFEKSFINHKDVCQNMWIEVEFDAKDDKNQKTQMACKDRRIESLNSVDVTPDFERPIVFTGGEAGILFATPCFIMADDHFE